jgi:hypothetical protein
MGLAAATADKTWASKPPGRTVSLRDNRHRLKLPNSNRLNERPNNKAAPKGHFAGKLKIRDTAHFEGSVPEPQKSETLPASSDFCPQQLVAGDCVLFERRLVGEVRRALGSDYAGSRTASYSFGLDESGNLGIAIVVRHDLSLLAGKLRTRRYFCCALVQYGIGQKLRANLHRYWMIFV